MISTPLAVSFRRIFLAALVGLLLCTPLAARAHSSVPNGPGFVLSGGPAGQVPVTAATTITEAYQVHNVGGVSLAMTVSVTGLTTQGAGPGFVGVPSPGLSVTADPASFTLPPGRTAGVLVRLRTGVHLQPGGLFAGLIFQGSAPTPEGTVQVLGAIGRPLLLTAPGRAVDSGVLVSFTASRRSPLRGALLTVAFRNTGNVNYAVGGSILLQAPQSQSTTLQLPSVTVLPHDTRTMTVSSDRPLPAGTVGAHVSLRWGLGAEHRTSADTTIAALPGAGRADSSAGASLPSRGQRRLVSPAELDLIAGGLLSLLLLLFLLLAVARLRHQLGGAAAPVEQGEQDRASQLSSPV